MKPIRMNYLTHMICITEYDRQAKFIHTSSMFRVYSAVVVPMTHHIDILFESESDELWDEF